MVNKKKVHFSRKGRIEDSVSRDYRLSSLGKPRDTKRRSPGRIFFYPSLTLMMYSYIINL